MNRSVKRIVLGLVVVTALLVCVEQASACGLCGCAWHRPVAYGCPTCVTSCDPCWDLGNWYVGVRPGPVRRLVFGPCRWYLGGCYSSLSCCAATCGGCGDCGCVGSDPVKFSDPNQPTPAKKPATPAPTESSPTMPAEPGLAPTTPAAPTTQANPQTGAKPENSGLLTVWVPYNAKVSVNGLVTKSTGTRREFVSYGLKPGFSYKYDVKAEIVRNGEIVEDVKTIYLTAGEDSSVAFGFDTVPQNVAAN